MDPTNVSVACRNCGQLLIVPTANLRVSFGCPRCGSVATGGDIVPPTTPIHAVPVMAEEAASNTLPTVVVANTRLNAVPPPLPRPQLVAHDRSAAQAAVEGAGASPQKAPAPHPVTVGLPRTPGDAQRGAVLARASDPENVSQELDKVGRFWARVLGLCDTIDAFLYGKKAWIVLALSVFAAVVGLLEWYSDQPPVFTVVTTFLLLFVLEALAIVRIGSLRDDDREWSLGLVFTRVGGVLSDGWDNITEFFGMPASLKLFVTGLVLAGSGLATLVGRNVAVCLARAASLVGFDAAADLEHLSGRLLYFGLGGVLCGGLFCLWSIKQDSDKRRELGGTGDYAGRLDGSSVALPAVIDCADTQAVDALARAVDHRLLRETLQVLAKWRPNLHENEAEYQRLLWRHIRQHLPAANPQRELPLRDPHTGRRGRADLVVGDAVLIEMKLKLSAGAVQRAVTQIAQYSRSWSNGPVMLLVCATDVEKARRCFGFEIEELRQKSSVCLVVAGGTRRELA